MRVPLLVCSEAIQPDICDLTVCDFVLCSCIISSGGPAPYNEDLYAPLPPPRSSGDSPDGVHSDIYESVQQHVRIIENIRLQPWPLAERKQYRQ